MKNYFVLIFLILSINLTILRSITKKPLKKKDRKLFLRWEREEKWKRHIDRERCKLIS